MTAAEAPTGELPLEPATSTGGGTVPGAGAAPTVRLRWGASTHRGRRRLLNEDSHLASGSVFVVADGMGGHEAGEIASALTVDALRPLSWLPAVTVEELRERLEVAHADVTAVATARGGRSAGTTLAGALLAEQGGVPYWLVVNIGDSRTYRYDAGGLEQVSTDHSEVAELVATGAITAEEAAHHPRRNVVTRALGASVRLEPDFWYVPVVPGDRLLVCSDGLTGELPAAHVAHVLATVAEPDAVARVLVQAAVDAGGRDNVTVVVVDVLAVGAAQAGDGEDDVDDTVPRRDEPEREPGRAPLDDDTRPRPTVDLTGAPR